jgi:hypothetical protein
VLLTSLVLAAQVFVPPVPNGIAHDGRALNKTEFKLPSTRERWLRVTSPHFTVISSARESETRELVTNLETYAVYLQQLHPRFRENPLAHSRVLLFARRDEAQPYFDLLLSRGTRAPGAFVNGEAGGTMVLSQQRMPDRTPFHELVHNLLAGPTRPPLWLEEGLAEYYSNVLFDRDQLRIGLRRIFGEVLLRGIRPMRELFAVKRDADITSDTAFYRQATGAVAWLLRSNPAAFDAFERDVENGMPEADALQKHYHATVGDLQQGLATMYRYDRKVVPAPKVNVLTTVEHLSYPDVLCELGSFLNEFDTTKPDAEKHFRAALAIDPRHARSLAGLGRFDEALAAAPDDPQILLTYAESLLGKAIGPFAGTGELGDVARMRKARELAQRALAHGADEARARGDYGVSFLAEADVAPAIAPLERAHQLAPQRADFALQLLDAYMRSDRAKADALYAELAHARDAQTVFAAKSLLVRELTHRANALVAEQKLDEAAAIVRELAKNTPEPNDLIRQAEQLERTADANRQIHQYNDAIARLHNGDRKGAIAVLDALLKTATDEQVIRDATALRNTLR